MLKAYQMHVEERASETLLSISAVHFTNSHMNIENEACK